MSNCVAFHTQIASIMEVLANAAVAEICKLVDDGYAVLRLEMSQSQKENESLRRKLQVLELRVAQACNFAEKTRTKDSSVNNRPKRGSVFDKFQGSTTAESDSTPSGQSLLDTGLLSDGEPTAEDQDVLSGNSCADLEEGRTESVLIKEERVEEDRDPQREMNSREERLVEPSLDDGKLAAALGNRSPSSKGREEESDQQRSRRHVWEVSGPDTVLKTEPECSSVTERLQHRGAEHRPGGLQSLDSEFVMFERPGQLGSYCTQGGAVTETEDPCCSYSTETDSESLAFRSELQFTASKDDGGHASLSAGSRDVNPDAPMEPVSVKIEADLQPAWSRRPVSELVYSEQRHGPVERGRQAALPHNVFSLRLPHNISATTGTTATAPQSNPDDVNGSPLYEKRCTASKGFRGHRKVCTRKRKFICKYCGKGFPRAKELEIHQRVHTGEKPFGCTHCGKRFTQKCNLKTHLSIHTGEKPFRCLQCGKGFVQSGYLKAHQRVHTGEKPFSCAKCGKRFGQSSYLRSHQSVHTGEKPFSCAHCGKGFTRSCHLKRHQTVHEPGNCADVDLF